MSYKKWYYVHLYLREKSVFFHVLILLSLCLCVLHSIVRYSSFSFSLHPILHPQTEDERDYNFVRLNWGQYMMFIEKVDSMHSYSWLEVLNLIKTELYFQFPFKCNHFGILLQCMMHLLSLPSNQLNNETIYAKSFVDVTETIKI